MNLLIQTLLIVALLPWTILALGWLLDTPHWHWRR